MLKVELVIYNFLLFLFLFLVNNCFYYLMKNDNFGLYEYISFMLYFLFNICLVIVYLYV